VDELPLFTLSEHQLEQVFADVVRYYDSDLSGDLNEQELARLLSACGLALTHKEVRQRVRACMSWGGKELEGVQANNNKARQRV